MPKAGSAITQMRSLKNTWQCAVSQVFHVTGAAVQFICSVTDNSSLDVAIIDKRVRFLEHLKLNSHHDILFTKLYLVYAGRTAGIVPSERHQTTCLC